MARSEARILTSIWQTDFSDLPAEAQRMYLLALSQPNLSLCGVTPYTPKRWAQMASNTSVSQVRRAILTLEVRSYVVVDERTEEVWIRTFIKYDGVLTKPNVTIAMSRDFPGIQSGTIRERFLEGLGKPFRERLAEGLWERLGEPFRKQFEKRFPENGGTVPGTPLAPAHAEPPSSILHPPSSSSHPPANGSADIPASCRSAVEEEDQEIISKALDIIAQRRMAKAANVVKPVAWIKATAKGLRAEYCDLIGGLDLAQFVGATQLADYLEPPTNGHARDASVAATRVRLADDEARSRNPCPKCDGNRQTFDGNFATPCDACDGTGIRP
jgi:hypothetical protein